MRFTPQLIDLEVARFRYLAIVVEPQDVPAIIAHDLDDDHVLAAAVAGGADYIVTGDPDLLDLQLYRGITILTPAAFLANVLFDDGIAPPNT